MVIKTLQNKLNVITCYSMDKYEEYVEEMLEENSLTTNHIVIRSKGANPSKANRCL